MQLRDLNDEGLRVVNKGSAHHYLRIFKLLGLFCLGVGHSSNKEENHDWFGPVVSRPSVEGNAIIGFLESILQQLGDHAFKEIRLVLRVDIGHV